jgi:hypothetical protein
LLLDTSKRIVEVLSPSTSQASDELSPSLARVVMVARTEHERQLNEGE